VVGDDRARGLPRAEGLITALSVPGGVESRNAGRYRRGRGDSRAERGGAGVGEGVAAWSEHSGGRHEHNDQRGEQSPHPRGVSRIGWPCYVRQPDKRRLGPRCYIFVANPFPPSRSTARQRLAAILKGMRPPASDPRTDRRDLLLAAGIFVLIDVVAAATQPLIDIAGGRGWDGATYYQVAQQLAAGIRPIADAPFVYRLGTPALAALLTPNDLFSGFVIVNAAANALTAMLVFLWLRRFIASSWIRLALFVSFVAMWHGPIRFFHFYPVSAEHLTYAANVI